MTDTVRHAAQWPPQWHSATKYTSPNNSVHTICTYGWETRTRPKGRIIMRTKGQSFDRSTCMRCGWPKKQPNRKHANHRRRRRLGARCAKIPKYVWFEIRSVEDCSRTQDKKKKDIFFFRFRGEQERAWLGRCQWHCDDDDNCFNYFQQ